jgi:hypothetical protein
MVCPRCRGFGMTYPDNKRVERCSCVEGRYYSDGSIARFDAALYGNPHKTGRGKKASDNITSFSQWGTGLQRVKLPHRLAGTDMQIPAGDRKVRVPERRTDEREGSTAVEGVGGTGVPEPVW